jgi:hypothetical protein
MYRNNTPSGHEFTAQQNKVIKDLSLAMKIVSPFFILAGVFFLIIPIIGWITGGIFIFLGVRVWGAATSMGSIVETEGDDIEHLMEAIQKVGSYFKVLGVFTLISLFFTTCSLLK